MKRITILLLLAGVTTQLFGQGAYEESNEIEKFIREVGIKYSLRSKRENPPIIYQDDQLAFM